MVTVRAATKAMETVEDGAFVTTDQPHPIYAWTFRMKSPYDTLALTDSNYPVSLSRSRFVRGDRIELKYCDLALAKQ